MTATGDRCRGVRRDSERSSAGAPHDRQIGNHVLAATLLDELKTPPQGKFHGAVGDPGQFPAQGVGERTAPIAVGAEMALVVGDAIPGLRMVEPSAEVALPDHQGADPGCSG